MIGSYFDGGFHMELVELKGGLTVPVEVLTLAFALQNRGLELRQDGDRLRVVEPGGGKPALTEVEVASITRWKLHILALLAYKSPDVP
jgi:hypothetical protein